MPRPRSSAPPSYRFHKPSGLGVVTLTDPSGRRKDVWLGPHGTPESRAEYGRVIAEWEAAGRTLAPGSAGTATPDITLNEVALAYLRHAEGYYRAPDGTPTGELDNLKHTIRALRQALGSSRASQFGPLAFKSFRERLVASGLCRGVVNQRCGHVKRMVGWAVSNELVPASALHALQAVTGLKKGRTEARETEPVCPVPDEVVERTLPFLRPPVRAMVELQRLTGMRPGEVFPMKAGEIDRSGAVWVYRPRRHKGTHLGKLRAVFLGPKARAVLEPLLVNLTPNDYLFSPERDDEARRVERRAGRKTPLWPSHQRHQAKRRKKVARRRPRNRFERQSYGVAIYRACDKAFPAPEPMAQKPDETNKAWMARLTPEQREELTRWQKAHRWHPNQLRHAHGTAVRKLFGLEAAQVALGHSKADVTQVYAERDETLAVKIAEAVG